MAASKIANIVGGSECAQ